MPPRWGYVGFMDYGCWAGTRLAPTSGRFSTVSRCESRPTGVMFNICPCWGYFVHWLINLMNSIHCAPLERGDWTYCLSIDISLLWSEGRTVDGRGNLAPTIDQDALSRIQNQSADRTRSVNSSSTVIARGPSGLSIRLTISDSSSRFSSSVSSST